MLVDEIQPECQTGVDPPVDDPAQSPCSRGMRQGVCDLGQAIGIGDRRETVPLLSEEYASPAGLAGDMLVTVQDHLRTERRVASHLDRQMTPIRVEDVERVVIDVGPAFGQVLDHGLGTLHVPRRCRRPGDEHHEHPMTGLWVLGEVVLGDLMFAFPGLAVDHRHPVGFRPATHPTSETARHPDQMSVVQLGVAVAVQPSPPHPEPARAVTHREVRVEHDPIDTVIRPGQQVAIAGSQTISHPATIGPESPATLHGLPRRGHRSRASEASLGSGVGNLGAQSLDL